MLLGRSHFLLYYLTPAIKPRMLVTLDEKLNSKPVSVRVGQVCFVSFLLVCAVRHTLYQALILFNHQTHCTIYEYVV